MASTILKDSRCCLNLVKMKTLYIIFTLNFICLFHLSSFTQNFWNNTFIVNGISLSEQDRRLFDFPGAAGVLRREDSKLDNERNLSLQKSILKLSFFHTAIGVGYSEYNTTFSRPFDHSQINGGYTEELRYVKRYTINKLIVPISNNLFLTKDQSLFLKFDILPAIAFRKSVKDLTFEKRETKWELELHSLELYSGVGVKISPRMQLAAHYRWNYIYKLDKVIFNHLLFKGDTPDFIQKKYDTYNPFKLWVTVSYALHP